MLINYKVYPHENAKSQQVTMDQAPEITKGRTFVPMRILSDSLGAEITFNARDKKVTITYRINSLRCTQTIEIWINKPYGYINGTQKPIDPNDKTVVPYISNERTMIPMRFIGEALLAKDILWDAQQKKVTFVFLK